MTDFLITMFSIVSATFIVDHIFFKKTDSHLDIWDDILMFGIMFFFTIIFSYLFDSHTPFSPFPTKSFVLSSLVALVFGVFILIPARVADFHRKKIQLEEQKKHEAETQAELIKESVRKALAERDAEKAGATEKGNAETPGTKA